MADPVQPQGQFYVKLDGAAAPEALLRAILEVRVESSLDLPSSAVIALHDPELHWIDAPALRPGVALLVSAKGEGPEQPLFDGEIVEVEPEIAPGSRRLHIRAYDRLHRLTRGRHVRSFQNVTDADVMRRLAEEAGLTVECDAASEVHEYLLQSNETNLEVIRRRAVALGCMLAVTGKILRVAPPPPADARLTLEWGASLTRFRARWSTSGQMAGASVRGWDPAQKREIVGRATTPKRPVGNGLREPGGKVATAAHSVEPTTLVADATVSTQRAADTLAQATLDRSEQRHVEAEGAAGGDARLLAGAWVKLTGVGERFSGEYFVTRAEHRYRPDQGYGVEFRLAGDPHSGVVGLLAGRGFANPVVQQVGLSIGVVTDNNDPESLGRVKILLPWLTGEHASHWARVASPGAGAERGLQFLPEVNDEVLVGFDRGDLAHPYVIGGLWNGVDPLPEPGAVSGGSVEKRVIRSRPGHVIRIDDASGAGGITIEDRKGNRVVISSADGSIKIESEGEMSLTARGSLKLKATGKLSIEGTGVEISGGAGNVDVKGTLINLN